MRQYAGVVDCVFCFHHVPLLSNVAGVGLLQIITKRNVTRRSASGGE